MVASRSVERRHAQPLVVNGVLREGGQVAIGPMTLEHRGLSLVLHWDGAPVMVIGRLGEAYQVSARPRGDAIPEFTPPPPPPDAPLVRLGQGEFTRDIREEDVTA